ncbi:MAG: MOSC domain-containing protein [Pararhodobacter sp.]|nr:MOSC domain-containing protein [Pararhodobacter sp.]
MSGARLAHICRHPVKSVGYEQLDRVTLTAGQAVPNDRRWAVVHEAAGFDLPRGWEPKQRFLRGAAEGRLQAVQARFDDQIDEISLIHPDCPPFRAVLPDGGDALVDWLRPLWPDSRPAPARLVSRTDGGALTDVPAPWVAILSMTSLRTLSQRMGRDLSIHRFRGNLWLDGLAPWQEFDLIDRALTIGQARLRVVARITRCVATCANPETGRTDADTLAALEQGWGHADFGVYAMVTQGGTVSVGDTVSC